MVKKLWPEEPNPQGVEEPLRSVRMSAPDPRPDLQEALAVVRLRKWSITAITLLVVGLALYASSRQTPIYQSQVSVLVTPFDPDLTDSVPPEEPNLATDAELIDSVAVAEIVAENLGISGPPRELLDDISVDQPADTEILEIGYQDPDPLQAQRRATGFADAYLQYRQETATQQIAESDALIELQIGVLRQRLQVVERLLDNMSATHPDRGSREAEASFLLANILQRQLDQVSIPDTVTVGRIIQPAPLPSSPVSPNHVVNGAFGLVAGLALGVGLAFLRDRLSERLRSSEETEAYLEAPLVGAIPRVAGWGRRKKAHLVTAMQWRSPAAEAYRILRTNLLSTASSLGVKTIAVTSMHAGEGKSATVANLGVVLARAGKRVSLVSADLRRPRLHEFFGREGGIGLTGVLEKRASLTANLQEVALPTPRGFDAAIVTLRLLPSGHVPDDPAELLTSEMMTRVISDLEEISDIVLIDLPPILPVTDALVVASLTKNVLLVIGPKASTRSALMSARQQLDRVGARILGGVLSGSDPSMTQGYTY